MASTCTWKRGIPWLILLLLAAGGYLWHLQQPRTLRVVKRWPFQNSAVSFTPQGVLCASRGEFPTYPIIFAQHDWDGNTRWQVQTDMGGYISLWNASDRYAVSPDGHILVVVKNEGPHLAILTWRNGTPLGTARVPLTQQPALGYSRMAVTNAGQVWILPFRTIKPADGHQTPALYVVQGDRVIASGCYRTQTPIISAQGYRQLLSPDGVMLLVEVYTKTHVATEYATCRLQGNRVVFERRYTAKRQYTGVSLLSAGRFITGDGAVFNLHGQVHPAAGWWQLRHPAPTPWQQTVVQHNGTNNLRILNVRTGKAWPLPMKILGMEGSDGLDLAPSADGRFAVVYTEDPRPARKPTPMRQRLYHLPIIGSQLQMSDQRAPLCVYEQPGKLRACRRINALPPTTRFNMIVNNMAISPDGHYVLYVEQSEKDRNILECVLYRW